MISHGDGAAKGAVVAFALALTAILVVPSSAALDGRLGTGAAPPLTPSPAGNARPTVAASSTPVGTLRAGGAVAPPATLPGPGTISSSLLGSLQSTLPGLGEVGGYPRETTAGPLSGPSYGVASTLDLLNGTSLPGNVLPPNCLYPMDALYDPDDARVWVTCYVSGSSTLGPGGEVVLLNGSSGARVGSAGTGFGDTVEALVDGTAGPVVVVADSQAANVTLLNASSGEAVASVTVGSDPVALAVNNTSGVVYVAASGAAAVWAVNVSTLSTSHVAVGAAPAALAYDPANGRLFVADKNASEVTVLNAGTLKPEQQVPVGGSPSLLAFDGPAGTVLVGNPGSSAVTVLNATTDAVVSSLPVAQPTALAVDPASGEAFVASGSGQMVLPVLASGLAGSPIPLGNATTFVLPYGLTVDAGNGELYVDTAAEPLADLKVPAPFSFYEVPVKISSDAVTGHLAVAGGIFNDLIGTPLLTALDPDSGLLVVPGSDAGGVSFVDVASSTVATTVDLGVVADAVVGDPENGDLYALDAAPEQLEVANGTTGEFVASVPVPGLLDTFLAFDPWQSSLLVAGGEGDGVSVIGATNHTAFSAIEGVGEPSASLADPLNGQLYLLSGGQLYAVNGLTDRLVASWPTVASGLDAFALGAGDATVYLANGSSVAVLDAKTDVMAPSIALGRQAALVAFDPANGDLYVTEPENASVAVVDTTTGDLLANVTVGAGAKALLYDRLDGDLYVADEAANEVSVINGTNNTVVATVATPASPEGFVLDSGTGNVYVGEPNLSALSLIDGATFSLRTTVPVGLGLAGAAFDPYDAAPVTVNELSGTLSFLDATAPTYRVTFTESGLPSGTPWRVTFGTSSNVSTSTTVTFRATNGTYTFAVAASDFTATPATGRLSVSGAGVGQSVAFAALPLYRITFSEKGLVGGTGWSVVLEGVANTSTGTQLTFTEPNGTYHYGPVEAANYSVSPSNGTVVVNGAAPSTVAVTFVELFHATFTETGLPSGTEWSVTVAGQRSVNATTASILVPEANATYGFTAASTNRAFSSPGGSFTVTGAAVAVPVTFTELFVRPSASVDPVDVGEATTISAGASGGSGTYPTYVWSGLPASCSSPGSVPSFSCTPGGQGTFTVEVTVTDSDGGQVTASFGLAVAPALLASPFATENPIDVGQPTTVSASASGGSGTYTTYAWSELPTGCPSPGSVPSFLCTPTGAGSFAVQVTVTDTNGAQVTAGLTLVVDPTLAAGTASASANPLDVGQTTTVSTSGATGGSGEYTLYAWAGLPPGCASTLASFSCTPTAAGTFTVNLTVTDSNGANATASFVLTVDPALVVAPSASKDPIRAGLATTISADASGGSGSYASYAWSGAVPSGCTLPTGTGTSSFGCTPAVGSQGSYPVSVEVTDSNGAQVSGSVTLTVNPAASYTVTFTETGLPTGTEWWANVSGQPALSSTSTTAALSLLNGSYSYTLATTDKEYAAAAGGLQVKGSSVPVAVTFSLVTYTITFVESGLPLGTGWYVNLTDGESGHSTSGAIVFSETNGSYTYVVGTVGGRWVPSPALGTVELSGKAVSEPVSFQFTYAVLVYRPANTPAGASWSVTLSGADVIATARAPAATSTLSSTGTTISFVEPNGSYGYWVRVSGTPSYNSSGSFTIDGAGVTLTPASVPTSGPSTSPYLLYGAVAAAVVVVVAAVLLLARRRRPRGPEPPAPGVGGASPPWSEDEPAGPQAEPPDPDESTP